MNVSHLNIYAATIPDRMHHLDLGLFNYQVTYTRELLKEWCGQIAVDELDNRLARIPRFPGLKIFKNGLENIKRFTADEFRNMMKVFIFVIEGRAPHGYGSIQVTRQVDPKYSGQVIKFITQYQVRLQV